MRREPSATLVSLELRMLASFPWKTATGPNPAPGQTGGVDQGVGLDIDDVTRPGRPGRRFPTCPVLLIVPSTVRVSEASSLTEPPVMPSAIMRASAPHRYVGTFHGDLTAVHAVGAGGIDPSPRQY